MKKLLPIVLALALPLATRADSSIPPPVIVTPAITNWVTVTNVVDVPVVSTAATIRVFTVLINTNQQPVLFMARMGDGSEIVAKASSIPVLTNGMVLGSFNTLLSQVLTSGTSYTQTNGAFRARTRR